MSDPEIQVGKYGLLLTVSETYMNVTRKEKRRALLLLLELIRRAKAGEFRLVLDVQRIDSLDREVKKALGIV